MCVCVREKTGNNEEGTSARCSAALGASFFLTKLPLYLALGQRVCASLTGWTQGWPQWQEKNKGICHCSLKKNNFWLTESLKLKQWAHQAWEADADHISIPCWIPTQSQRLIVLRWLFNQELDMSIDCGWRLIRKRGDDLALLPLPSEWVQLLRMSAIAACRWEDKY